MRHYSTCTCTVFKRDGGFFQYIAAQSISGGLIVFLAPGEDGSAGDYGVFCGREVSPDFDWARLTLPGLKPVIIYGVLLEDMS